MRVLSVASEMYPLVKTGGLADVAGALPVALKSQGVDMRTIIPGYSCVLDQIEDEVCVLDIKSLQGEAARILHTQVADREVYVLDAPALFHRPGGPYSDLMGHDWSDNWQRFAAFSQAAAMIGEGALKGWKPQIVHAHDWQGALTHAYMRSGHSPRTPLIMTIHNLAFQGRFNANIFGHLELPKSCWDVDGIEFYGDAGYLKAGLVYADAITTVSPTYSEEILEPENGMGLDGLLNAKSENLLGVLNGIDDEVWNPAADKLIARQFSAETLATRFANKRALEAETGLDEDDDSPIFVCVSRLTWQKGMDVLAETLDHIIASGARLVMQGAGDRMLEGAFLTAANRHRGRVAVRIGYDESFAHMLLAGGDGILIPSRFEPCGLTQLYGLRYGCVPVVSRVGGLTDTIIDANEAALSANTATGFVFNRSESRQLRRAVTRFQRCFQNKQLWRGIQLAGMRSDFSWSRSAKSYAALYHQLTGAKSLL